MKTKTAPRKDPRGKKAQEEDEDFKYIVRIANTNIDGHKTVEYGLAQIKGIGIRTSKAILNLIEFDPHMKVGKLSDEEVERLANAVNEEYSDIAPAWLLNRRKDYDTGGDVHMVGTEIPMVHKDDLNRLKKIRCYRGIRHENNHKVRGQRTRSNGRSGLSLGVRRKKS